MELVVIPTSMKSMEVFSVMIVFIVSNSSNLSKKNHFLSPKQPMENILSPTIKKTKISLYIISVMEAEEISMSPQTKEATLILINGEMKLASSSETVWEVLINSLRYIFVYFRKILKIKIFSKKANLKWQWRNQDGIDQCLWLKQWKTINFRFQKSFPLLLQ